MLFRLWQLSVHREVLNPLWVWHQQEGIYFEEQRSSQAPGVKQWAWVSLCTFLSSRHAGKHSHVLAHPNTSSLRQSPLALLPRSPLFVLQVPAAVVEENVAVFGQRSLHHPDAAVKEALKLGGVKDLLPLLLRQLPQHRKRACQREREHKHMSMWGRHRAQSTNLSLGLPIVIVFTIN